MITRNTLLATVISGPQEEGSLDGHIERIGPDNIALLKEYSSGEEGRLSTSIE